MCFSCGTHAQYDKLCTWVHFCIVDPGYKNWGVAFVLQVAIQRLFEERWQQHAYAVAIYFPASLLAASTMLEQEKQAESITLKQEKHQHSSTIAQRSTILLLSTSETGFKE